MTDDVRTAMIELLPRLRAFARSLARSAELADDLVQATCEKALRAQERFEPGTRLDSWMFRIMHNQWIDTVRGRRPQAPIEEMENEPALVGEDGVRSAEAKLTLADASRLIDALPEEQRAVLVLVCVEELSYRETAEVLAIPVGTVMSRLSRARQALADAMEGGDRHPSRISGTRQ